jgi:hypothetical protein
MPKTIISESVLHDWVHVLPFQMQALLLTAVRGPDGTCKHNHAKAVTRYLRGAVIKPAGKWSSANNNDFMWGEYNLFQNYADAFWHDHDEYPHHFIMHLIHCAEVIGYYHPKQVIRESWNKFYLSACESFHMNPESQDQLAERLNDFGVGYHNTINEQFAKESLQSE